MYSTYQFVKPPEKMISSREGCRVALSCLKYEVDKFPNSPLRQRLYTLMEETWDSVSRLMELTEVKDLQ